jgi:Flp pilus assembly protein TadG
MLRRRDRGSVPIETAMLAPVMVLFVLIVVAAGRVQSARAAVEESARAGARAASLARTDAGAQQAADDAVNGALGERGVHCTHNVVETDPKRLGTPVGDLETVTVTVRCTVDLGDLMDVNRLNWNRTVTGTFTSVKDRYRGN